MKEKQKEDDTWLKTALAVYCQELARQDGDHVPDYDDIASDAFMAADGF